MSANASTGTPSPLAPSSLEGPSPSNPIIPLSELELDVLEQLRTVDKVLSWARHLADRGMEPLDPLVRMRLMLYGRRLEDWLEGVSS